MIPKEKAQELVEKMKYNILFNAANIVSKDCALIAVDEIIDNWNNEAAFQHHSGKVINYWNVVKEEIEKL